MFAVIEVAAAALAGTVALSSVMTLIAASSAAIQKLRDSVQPGSGRPTDLDQLRNEAMLRAAGVADVIAASSGASESNAEVRQVAEATALQLIARTYGFAPTLEEAQKMALSLSRSMPSPNRSAPSAMTLAIDYYEDKYVATIRGRPDPHQRTRRRSSEASWTATDAVEHNC
jgi:hypothetical protein